VAACFGVSVEQVYQGHHLTEKLGQKSNGKKEMV
jgi:hypothetical protein